MGLDWVVDLRNENLPERATIDTPPEEVREEGLIPSASGSDEQLEASPFDQPWSFRAQRVDMIRSLPDETRADLYRDMAPPQMRDLAAELERALDLDEEHGVPYMDPAAGITALAREDGYDVENPVEHNTEEDGLTADQRATIEEAIAWLRYWADESYWVLGSW